MAMPAIVQPVSLSSTPVAAVVIVCMSSCVQVRCMSQAYYNLGGCHDQECHVTAFEEWPLLSVFAVVNIPDGATGEGALAASAGGSPHVPFPRISSFTGSEGNRRHRRKPFKSSSNHSLKAGHPQKLTNTAHDPLGLHGSSGEASSGVKNSGPESHDGSQQSYSTYAASHDAPVHGFHVQSGGGLHPPHPNDRSLSSDSPRWEKVDGVYDDAASSIADSQQTSPTTSSNNTGIEPEQKRLITPEREFRTKNQGV